MGKERVFQATRFSEKTGIFSLFGADTTFFTLDEKTCLEMMSGQARVFIDYSVALDTQAISYINRQINGQIVKNDDFLNVFDFLLRNDIPTDPVPYISENFRMIKGGNSSEIDSIIQNLYTYEKFKKINKKEYMDNKIIKYLISDIEAKKMQKT